MVAINDALPLNVMPLQS